MTDTVRDVNAEAGGWSQHADALAAFVVANLPNRCDVWGAYIRAENRRPDTPNVWTAPAKERRGLEALTTSHLVDHFRATHAGELVGLHTTSPENTSRWFGLDFDVHANSDEQRDAVARGFAWCVDALGERIALLLEDSNGLGGRHLWGYFDAPVSTPALYVYLAGIVGACEEATGYKPETYPKQPRLTLNRKGEAQVGNWLRLPGRHHTRAHWSRLAVPGGIWRSGAAAARLLLDWPPTEASAIPPIAAYEAIKTPPPVRQQFPKLLAAGLEGT